MKILFLTNTLVLPGQPGLPRPWRVASFLQSLGHDVTVIANQRHYLDDDLIVGGSVEAPLTVEEVRVIGVKTSKGRRKSILRRIRNFYDVAKGFRRAALAQESADLIIVGTPPPLFTSFVGWKLKRRFGCKAILEIRDLYPHSAVGMGIIKNKGAIWLWQKAENLIQNLYDHIVVVVPGMVPMLEKQGVPRDKISIITNGYDLENDYTAPLEGEVKDYFDAHDARHVIVYGGNMGLANDVGTMLRAAEALKDDDRFRFAFFGEGQCKETYLETVAEKDLHNVRFFASQTRPVISAIFRKAFALMHGYSPSPLWDYALPNKIFEYHGAARPVVFAGGGEIAALIQDADSGLIVPQGDSIAIAQALQQLAKTPETADAQGANGRQYILENFSRDTIFARWTAVLDKVAQ